MELIEFRKISTEDITDDYYNDGAAWSRIYEYPLVFSFIKTHFKNGHLIHNSSWGFTGIHVLFKEKLDEHFNVEHSDIRSSNLKNTFIYDITKRDESLKNKYDIVINISTLEEVSADHIKIFYNLYDQVKPGGYLMCTFDIPGLQVEMFEKLFNKKLLEDCNSINGINSKLQNLGCSNLNCGFFIVKKYE